MPNFKSSAVGRAAFLADWPSVGSFWSLNNEGTDYGVEGDTFASGSFSQVDTAAYPDYGLDNEKKLSNGVYADLHQPTDVQFLIYIPPDLATGTYGLFSNGGGGNGQGAFLHSTDDGDTIEVGMSHNISGGQDSVTYTLTERGWAHLGFQYEDNSGNMAIWVNGTRVVWDEKDHLLLVGSGDFVLGNESIDNIGNWGNGDNLFGTGIRLANFMYDNRDNDTSMPAGNGDQIYIDYYAAFVVVSTAVKIALGDDILASLALGDSTVSKVALGDNQLYP